MANAIQIKRRASSGSAGKPNASSLKWGELAFNEADNILYYGYGSGNDQANTVQEIGGSGYFASRSGANASGLWPISINGNAETATSGVTYAGTPSTGYIPKFTDFNTIENGYEISTNLGTNNSASFIPRADAVKNYVDAIKQGLDIKDSVRVATTTDLGQYETSTNVIYAVADVRLPNIDGVTLNAGDRILVKNETSTLARHNGIYYVEEVGVDGDVPWQLRRATDADSSAKVTAGMFAFVTEGDTNADTGWVLTTNDTINLNTTQLSFSQFSSAGQIYDGAGLYKVSNTINVGTADSGRIIVNADNIDLASISPSSVTGSNGVSFVQSIAVDVYGRTTSVTTATVQDATTSNKGIASFSDSSFNVSSGAVSIKNSGISNNQLANSSLSIGDTSISLGSVAYALSGLSILKSDELDATTLFLGQSVSGPFNRGSIAFKDAEEDILINFNGSDLVLKNTISNSGIVLDADYTKMKAASSANNNLEYFAVFDSDPTSSAQILKSVSKSVILDDIGAATSGLTLTAGSGLTGGGNLSTDRRFDVGQGDGISVSADSIAVDSTVVRTTGNQTIQGNKTFSNNVSVSGDLAAHKMFIVPTGTLPGQTTTMQIAHGGDSYFDYYMGAGSVSSGYLLLGIHTDVTSAPFRVVINNSAGTSSITNATWDATTIAVNKGGTGQTSYTNGQLLIGNTTGNTLTKATLSSGTAIDITNGTGSITIGHADTSTLLGAQGVSGIASISVDGLGHVTSVETANFVTIGNLCTAIGNCPIDGGTF